MDLGIAGKWALVGGASKGLGWGCARALALEGVNVVMVARGAEALQASTLRLRTETGGTIREAVLRGLGVTQLVIAGVTTEVCVQTTMREANDRGFDCLLVEEATASYFPEFKRATIDMIVAQGGIVGWAAPLASVGITNLPALFTKIRLFCNMSIH